MVVGRSIVAESFTFQHVMAEESHMFGIGSRKYKFTRFLGDRMEMAK